MKQLTQTLLFACTIIFLCSCGKSNTLTQGNAEKTIRRFLADRPFATLAVVLNPAAISKIENTNIYSQFNTNVRVHFNRKEGQGYRLLFDFTRTPDNRWYLKKVEGVEDTPEELASWLATNKKLNIPAQ
ncbi:MAG: hypothetical protein JWP69_1061 [Flaviaesturariibacter sp.]|nr:hypothetical protein [Flaviaesturariibacter sp.]